MLLYDSIDKKNLLILLLLALFVRVFVSFQTHVIALDAAEQYIPAAHLYAVGEFKNAFSQAQNPIYPLLMALVSKMGMNLEIAGRSVSVFFGFLTVVPLYLLGRNLFRNSTIAFLTGFLFAIHPYLVRYSGEVLKETTYIFLFVTVLWLSWEALSKKRVSLFPLAGVFAGLCCLTRIDGIEAIVIVSLWILLQNLSQFKVNYKKKIASILLFSLCFSVIIAPYIWHIKQTTGKWNVSRKKDVQVFVGLKEFSVGEEISAGEEPRVVTVSPIKKHAQSIFLLIGKSVDRFHPLMLLLLIFGLIGRKIVPYRRREEIFLASFFVIHLLVLYLMAFNYSIFQDGQIVLNSLSGRHLLPLIVISIFWMGIGAYEIGARLHKWHARKRNIVLSPNLSTKVLVCVLVAISLIILPKTLAPRRTDKIGRKVAGGWIKEHSSKEKPVILTHMPRVAYYAGGRRTLLFKTSYNNSLESAGNYADYVVVNDKDIEQWSPSFLKPHEVNGSLKLVFEYQEKRGDTIMVYKVAD